MARCPHKHSDNLGRCLFEDEKGDLHCAYEGTGKLPADPGDAAIRASASRERRRRLFPRVYRIIGTDMLVFEAVEPYAGHSTISTPHEGREMGRVGTRPLPADLEALPGWQRGIPGSGAERIKRVEAWHEAQYREAYRAIIAKYPEARHGTRRMGQIEVTDRALANRLAPEAKP